MYFIEVSTKKSTQNFIEVPYWSILILYGRPYFNGLNNHVKGHDKIRRLGHFSRLNVYMKKWFIFVLAKKKKIF